MSDKKKVYVETSVISNLTARPSSRVVEAGRQIATIEWWERATQEYELKGGFYGKRIYNGRIVENKGRDSIAV